MVELKVYATLLLITFAWHVYKIIKICFEQDYSYNWLWGVYDRAQYELFCRNRLIIIWSAITLPLTFFWILVSLVVMFTVLIGLLFVWLMAIVAKTFIGMFLWIKGLKIGSKIRKYFTEDLDQKHW